MSEFLDDGAPVPSESEPETHPVMEAINRLEGVMSENEQTLKAALHSLRTTVVEQYQRTTQRLDAHARELRRIKEHIHLTDPPPTDGL